MRKIEELHFKLFLLFLIIMPIWSFIKWISTTLMIGLVILDILYFLNKRHKKKRIDIIDIMFTLLPIYYLLPYLFGLSVNNISDKLYYLFMEFGISFSIITIRRYLDKDNKNKILLSLLMVGIIYFFIAIVYQAFPKALTPLRINSYFGDTYFNSIDRFYGTLDYCNMSALFFVICFFISLFKIEEDEYNKYIYYFATFINMLGFLITYSKMVTIDFIIVSVTLIIYLIIRKKKILLSNYTIIIASLLIPMLISIRYTRLFLINLNLVSYLLILGLSFLLYIMIIKCFDYISRRFKFIVYLSLICEILVIIYFTINPIMTSLRINNVMSRNDYIISDFILNNDAKYEVSLDIEYNSKSNIKIALCGLYVGDDFIPKEDIIKEFEENEEINYVLDNNKKYEYYYIKIKNINKKTDILVKKLMINKKEYLVNSAIVPYQYTHQINLLKYDSESASSRFTYYKDSLKMLKDYGYVLGHGYSSFSELKNNYVKRYNERDPHSYLFQLWLDTGLYGVIYIILMIVISIYDMYKYRKCDNKIIFFVLFSLCILVLPFDLIYTSFYMKFLLMLFFTLLNDKVIESNN